jgi:protein CpxP
MKSGLKTLLVAALLAGTGLSAMAQNRAPEDSSYEHHSAMRRMNPEKMQEIHAKHIAELKAKLKITTAQEAGWTAFTNAMKPPGTPTATAVSPAEIAKLPTPERLDKLQAMHTERMAQHSADMNKRHQAIKTLYAILSAEQKKTFDDETSHMHERMHNPQYNPDHDRRQDGKHNGADH